MLSMRTVGERIRALRIENSMSQQQVADILHMYQSNYSKYELGKLEPNNDMLIKLAKLFDVTTDYLLGLADQ